MQRKVPDHYVQIILGVLVAFFLFLCFLLVRQYDRLARRELMNTLRSRISSLHRPLSASDASLIRSWMTFDYINTTFKIPSDIIKSSLSITDARYPRISLSKYAKTTGTTSAAFVSKVEDVVRNYLVSKQ